MSYRLAKSLIKLREQINAAYPERDKSSDGWIGDASHASRKSDHNPWVIDANGMGVVTATDTDEDLSAAIHSIESIVSAIRASRDKRVKYIIYEQRITVEGSELQKWKPYTGTNPHNHHAHISVFPNAKLYDDDSPWVITGGEVPLQTFDTPLLQNGSKGPAVVEAQKLLIKYGQLTDNADGDFGPNTEAAVRKFQQANGLDVDGKIGPNTWKKLMV